MTNRHGLLAALILVLSLGVTWLAWEHERDNIRMEQRSRFDFALRQTVSRIEKNIAIYQLMLRGIQSLTTVNPLIDRATFSRYVDALQPDASISGVQVFGIAERVAARDKAVHVADMRRMGYVNYVIMPAGERAEYAPIVQFAPHINANNAEPLGFDVWSASVHREAMERARDSGMPAITAPLQLPIKGINQAQLGFVMYLPVFATSKPHNTLTARRKNIVGWVYAAFQMNDFMTNLFGDVAPGLVVSMYEGINTIESALIYRSTTGKKAALLGGPKLLAKEYMVVGGQTWTLQLQTQNGFNAQGGHLAEYTIVLIGVALSVSLALLTWFMVGSRARALALAEKMTEELRHIAQHDPLTHLPNRALFDDRMHQALIQAKRNKSRFAVIFIDLDNFKPVNDNLGHAAGDRLLQDIAQRLLNTVRSSDTVGRIGGDEFVVLMPEVDGREDALILANKLLHAIRHSIHINGKEIVISCSVGVAVYPEDGADEIALKHSADDAMYRAKQGGRNQVFSAAATGDTA